MIPCYQALTWLQCGLQNKYMHVCSDHGKKRDINTLLKIFHPILWQQLHKEDWQTHFFFVLHLVTVLILKNKQEWYHEICTELVK